MASTPRLRGRKAVEQRKRRLMRTKGLCEDCLPEGRITLAEEVHHVIALQHGGPDTDDNTANLCTEHHLKREGKRVHRPIGKDGWPLN